MALHLETSVNEVGALNIKQTIILKTKATAIFQECMQTSFSFCLILVEIPSTFIVLCETHCIHILLDALCEVS